MAFRTDLAVEAVQNLPHAADSAAGSARPTARLKVFRSAKSKSLTEHAAQEIGKPCGRYVTLELDALVRREEDAFPRACRALSTLLGELLPDSAASGPVLVTGLGNRMITPDAIGPQAIDHVIATRHLVEQVPDVFASWRPVSALAPGVLGQTGVETGEVICGVLDRVKPAAVLAVDALAAGRLSPACCAPSSWPIPASRPARVSAMRAPRSTATRLAYPLSPLAYRPWLTARHLHTKSPRSWAAPPARLSTIFPCRSWSPRATSTARLPILPV